MEEKEDETNEINIPNEWRRMLCRT